MQILIRLMLLKKKKLKKIKYIKNLHSKSKVNFTYYVLSEHCITNTYVYYIVSI